MASVSNIMIHDTDPSDYRKLVEAFGESTDKPGLTRWVSVGLVTFFSPGQ